MRSFLQRFAAVVAGVLRGFDRVVFKGRLPQLYSPEGMNCYASANHVLLVDFKKHAKEVTVGDPDGPKAWRVMQRSVADTYRRAEVSQKANERYLEALSSVAATETLEQLVTPWCRRVVEPGAGGRRLRALNPFAPDDLALLTAVTDPRWLANGLRNRDLAEALYGETPADPAERKRRSARVSRLLRLLRAHGIIKKVPQCHCYQVREKARDQIFTLLAARTANPQDLTGKTA
jgi:hypothetical protein